MPNTLPPPRVVGEQPPSKAIADKAGVASFSAVILARFRGRFGLQSGCRVASPTDKVVRLGTLHGSAGLDTPFKAAPSLGQPAAPDDPKVASIRKAADQGDANAQSTLGFMRLFASMLGRIDGLPLPSG